MADLSDPKIDEAYQDVRSDKSTTNWLLLDYVGDRSDKLQVTKSGSDGLEELCQHLDDTKASYAYARVTYANDKESTREKFILVVTIPVSLSDILALTHVIPFPQVWIGHQCRNVMRKAKVWAALNSASITVSVHSANVKSALRVYSIEVAAQHKDDLREESIVPKLRTAGGASYDGV
ncbi:hypothetical protein H0H92_007596 [Tricholoma furcatifolium]|nr:hypothetical protein H0H92_007596 [Tricholoma furcatifolium]